MKIVSFLRMNTKFRFLKAIDWLKVDIMSQAKH